MVPADSGVGQARAAAARLDPESAEWLRALAGTGPQHEAAVAQLHELLVRIAQGEVRWRGPRLRITGPELDDLALQAAADVLVVLRCRAVRSMMAGLIFAGSGTGGHVRGGGSGASRGGMADGAGKRRSRSALPTTVTELVAMATAASTGGRIPAAPAAGGSRTSSRGPG
jgi:hypothetical protein